MSTSSSDFDSSLSPEMRRACEVQLVSLQVTSRTGMSAETHGLEYFSAVAYQLEMLDQERGIANRHVDNAEDNVSSNVSSPSSPVESDNGVVYDHNDMCRCGSALHPYDCCFENGSYRHRDVMTEGTEYMDRFAIPRTHNLIPGPFMEAMQDAELDYDEEENGLRSPSEYFLDEEDLYEQCEIFGYGMRRNCTCRININNSSRTPGNCRACRSYHTFVNELFESNLRSNSSRRAQWRSVCQHITRSYRRGLSPNIPRPPRRRSRTPSPQGGTSSFPTAEYAERWKGTKVRHRTSTFEEVPLAESDTESEEVDDSLGSFREMYKSIVDALDGVYLDSNSLQYMRIIETVGLYFYLDFRRFETWGKFIAATYRLFSTLTGFSVAEMMHSWIGKLIEALDVLEPQSAVDTFASQVRDASEAFLSGELYSRLRKVVCALASVAMAKSFDKMFRTQEEGSFNLLWSRFKRLVKNWDLLTTVMEFIKWLCTRGAEIMTGQTTFANVLFEPEEAAVFDERVAQLNYLRDEIEQGRTPDGKNFDFYVNEIIDLECKARKAMRETSDGRLTYTLQLQLKQILSHKGDINRLSATQPLRREPFALLIVGSSSVGKSCVTSYICPQLQRAGGLKQGPEYVYNVDVSDKYMSGAEFNKNTFTIDDLANALPQVAEKQASDIVIHIINNYKRFAIMADVDSKGKIPINPDIVIASTNEPSLGASNTSVSPLAVMRRFKYHLVMKVRPACGYGSPNNLMLKKGHNPVECRYQCWTFDVQEAVSVEVSPNQFTMRTVDGLAGVDLCTVMQFLVTKMKEHMSSQNRLLEQMKVAHEQEYCEHDIFRHLCLTCDRASREDAVAALPLHLQLGTQSGRLEPQSGNWLQDFTWGVGNALASMGTSLKQQSLNEEAKEKIQKSFGWKDAAKLWMALAHWKQQKMAQWQWLLLGIWGIAFPFISLPMLATGMAYGVGLSLSASMLVVLTTALRIVRYARIPMYQTLTSALVDVRKNWRDRLRSLVPLVCVVSASYATYKAWKFLQERKKRKAIITQGCRVTLPIPPGVSQKRDPYRPVYIEPVGRNIELQNSTSDQVSALLRERLCIMRFMRGSVLEEYQITMPVCTNFWLASYHSLKKDYDAVEIRITSGNAVNGRRRALLRGNWKRIGNTDYCLVYLPIMSDQKDFRTLLPLRKDKDKVYNTKGIAAVVSWITATKGDEPGAINMARNSSKVRVYSDIVSVDSLGFSYMGGTYDFPELTREGLCGSPIISDTPGPYLLGLHSAGITNTPEARYCTLYREDVQRTIDDMTSADTAKVIGPQSGQFEQALHFKGTQFEFKQDVRPGATTQYIDDGTFMVYGSSTAPHRTFRSRCAPTIIEKPICDAFQVESTHGPPRYIGSWVPFNVFATASSHSSKVDGDILDRAYSDFKDKIESEWNAHPEWKWEERIHPVAEDAVLSGIDGYKGCYAMNFNASMGIPWCKPKKDFIKVSDRKVPGISCPRDMPDEIRAEIEKMEATLLRGERVYAPHRANLKDEPTKKTKAKVRVFMGSSFPYLYLMRKYFLMISIVMQEHPELFECAVGVNAQSAEWTRMYKHIFKFGAHRTVAGDFVQYDQKMYVNITLAAFKLILWILERCGYTQDQLTICRGLMIETCMAIIDLKNEWVSFLSGIPSGHSLTVVINSLYDLLKMRCAYYYLCPYLYPEPFHRVVSLVTYGDDNVMSVREGEDWFNHTTIAAAMAHFGMEYTMADKTSESVPYIHANDCEFLKRKWVWSEKYQRHLCPLVESSIFKSLTCALRSDVLSPEAHAADIMISANREFWFHGEERFAEAHSKLEKIARDMQILHHMPRGKLPNYHDLEVWYMGEHHVTGPCQPDPCEGGITAPL